MIGWYPCVNRVHTLQRSVQRGSKEGNGELVRNRGDRLKIADHRKKDRERERERERECVCQNERLFAASFKGNSLCHPSCWLNFSQEINRPY